MCRYAFNPYRAHYACCTCRKTFKAPRQQDTEQWRKVEYLAAYC